MGKLMLNGIEYASSPLFGFPPLIYSTDEREVGVWVNGKPLYQKTIISNQIPINDMKYIPHEVSNIDAIVHFQGVVKNVNSKTVSPLIRVNDATNIAQTTISVDVTETYVVLKGRLADYSGIYDTAIITIQYTKTTDTPGSGKWASNGDIAHHYSTNEQIIGTWIDGKPIYEKQFHVTSITANDNWQLIGNTSIDLLVDYECLCITNAGRSGNQTSFRSDKNTPQIQGDNSNGNLYYALVSGTSISEFYVTARYTKTTD